MFDGFKTTFRSARKMIDDAERIVSEVHEQTAGGVSITNNNGHVVIVGPVRSLRVNNKAFDLTENKK